MARRLEPLVKTVDGLLRGRIFESVRGGYYFSFQGIPYAQPPIGPLRFKAPKQVKSWTGERKALKEGPSAPSLVMASTIYVEESDEDCLYLNVYTRELSDAKTTTKKPVMVWIHGGGFSSGSGNEDIYGPEHLIVKDIVLITINYRLGALGFLSLQNNECPGNNGLKDQVEALRWVKRNVSAFGGDPDNVTIFGESAGGASVQYLMLSPLSRGLFHRAITQSGSVLNPWACARQPVASAFKLGELLGLKTDSNKKLLDFLMTVPAKKIVEASSKVMRLVEPDVYYNSNSFTPVIEPVSANAFISEPLEKMVQEGRFHDVPYILGVNTLEGLICAPKGLPPLNTNKLLERLIPVHRNIRRGSPLADSILEEIKAFYFPNGYDEKQCADVLSAVNFLAGNDEAIRGLSNAGERRSHIYVYLFSYDCGSSLMKQLYGYSDWKGSFHTDELQYLFYSHMVKPPIEPRSDNERVNNMMCELWTNFALTGNPTPHSKQWPPYSTKNKIYLEIGEKLQTGTDLYGQQMNFWAGIFNKIYNLRSPKL